MTSSRLRKAEFDKSGLYRWCLLILVCVSLSASGQEARDDAVELSPGQVISRDLKATEVHVYKISVKAEQYLQIQVNQRGSNVYLSLSLSDKTPLASVDRLNGAYGPESLSFITKAEGVIFLRIYGPYSYLRSQGRYDVSIVALRPPNQVDKLRIEAEKAFDDAQSSYYWQTETEYYKRALEKYDRVLRLWEKIDDPYWQAFTLSRIASLRTAHKENAAAFQAHTRALPLFRLATDLSGEYQSLTGIGTYHFGNKENDQALSYFSSALSIAAQLGDKLMEIRAQQNVARTEWILGQQQLAIDHFQQSLVTARSVVENPYEEAFAYDQAIEFLNEVLRVKQMEKDPAAEAGIYLDLGWVYGLRRSYDCGPSVVSYQKAFAAAKNDSNQTSRLTLFEKLESALRETAARCGAYQNKTAAEAYLTLLQILEIKQNQQEIADALEKLGDTYLRGRQPSKSIERFEAALTIWKSLGDLKREAYTLDRLGDAYQDSVQNDKAHAFWSEAAAAKRKTNDTEGEISVLFKQAKDFSASDRLNNAAQFYEELSKIKSEGNSPKQIISQIELGSIYLKLNRADQAISRLESAVLQAKLPNWENRILLTLALNNLGELYRLTGKLEKAIDSYQTAIRNGAWEDLFGSVPLPDLILGSGYDSIQRYLRSQEIPDFAEERQARLAYKTSPTPILNAAVIFNNLGLAYYSIGKYELAKKEYDRAQEFELRFDPRASLTPSLVTEVVENNLGLLYKTLAQYDKALSHYQQILERMERIHNRAGLAITLNNLGGLYEAKGEHERAIETLNRALDIMREVKDRKGENTVLNNLGSVYLSLKQAQQARKYFDQALTICRQIKDWPGEADTLSNLGSVHLLTKDYETATAFYQEALIIERESGDRLGQATVLHNLMLGARAVDNKPVAIFYGKQAVNALQQLRSNTSGLGKNTQLSFLRSKEDTYRTLAELLVDAGRIPEAEVVLEMLKEEEFSQYVRRDAREIEKLSKRIDLREDERAALECYTLLADKLTAKGLELTQLEDKKNSLPAGVRFAEQARYDELVQQLAEANKAFRLFLQKQLADEIRPDQKADIELDRALQGKLKQWGVGTVALYTIVGEERYRVILTTPTTQSDGKTEIRATALNQKIFAFREALQNPRIDPRPLGKQLYDILLKPIENDLKGAQAQTLICSLDGTLRYIPWAALWDGEQYLAQKYRIVVVTSTTRQSLSEMVNPNRRVLGLGVTSESKVTEPFGTTSLIFEALPGVDKELQAIVSSEDAQQKESGIFNGKRLVDGEFTVIEMENRLTQRESDKRKYNIIHFATHFRLGGDIATSFLVLGNNKTMTLEQVSDSPKMNFTDVELVTLSACNTGYGNLSEKRTGEKVKEQFLKNNGKEVDSLAAFIEVRGAKAIMATLWRVADESTQLLMTKFYALGKENPDMAKAEALQQTQLSLLTGNLQQTTSGKDSNRAEPIGPKLDGKSAQPLFKADPKAPYAHPYYWAPFILIGNWR